MAQPTRCGWAGPEPIYLDYHDHEWGRPTHDDRALFELLSLEGMQAGLSWITILKKREAFRAAFADFEPAAVARFDEAKVAELMQNAGIVRNRRKIVSVIENARHFLEVQREFGSFDRFLWAYVDGKPIVNSPETDADVPASTHCEPLGDPSGRPCHHAALRPHQPRPEKARLHLRRHHYRLLPAPVGGAGGRPSEGLRLARQLPSAGITRNRGELRELSSVRFERCAAAVDFLLCAAY